MIIGEELTLIEMEASGIGAFLRNRRLGSYFDTSSGLNFSPPSKVMVKKKEMEKKQKSDVYMDEDGWLSVLISWVRIVVCFTTMMFTTFIWALIMLVLLPWPYQRIRQGNIYGHVTGRLLVSCFKIFLWISFDLMNVLVSSFCF